MWNLSLLYPRNYIKGVGKKTLAKDVFILHRIALLIISLTIANFCCRLTGYLTIKAWSSTRSWDASSPIPASSDRNLYCFFLKANSAHSL